MKLLFARRWKKIPHSRNLYPKISGHILSFSSNAQNSLLENWPGKYREPINKFIPYIVSIKDFSDKCKANYIDSKTWSSFALSFRRKLVTNPLEVLENIESLHKLCDYIDKANKIQMWPELSKKMDDNSRSSSPPSSSSSTTPTLNTSTEIVIDENKTNRLHLLEESTQFIFEQMFKKALIDLMPIIEASKAFLASNSVRFPPQWYPYARMQKRKIIYHGGPTNSGKTHQALERLRMADSDKGGGLYCGPLRLLAAEIYERLNKQGVYTDLLTGQEKIVVPFSTHLSCTLEMVNTSRQYDVAVVDEIQMIGDMDRGFAW